MLMAASWNFSSSSSAAAARVLLYRESNRSSNSYTLLRLHTTCRLLEILTQRKLR